MSNQNNQSTSEFNDDGNENVSENDHETKSILYDDDKDETKKKILDVISNREKFYSSSVVEDIKDGQSIPGLYHLLYLKKDKGSSGLGTYICC
jgi:hypothetical protein